MKNAISSPISLPGSAARRRNKVPGAAADQVSATTQPALPAIDRDADALIADLFNHYARRATASPNLRLSRSMRWWRHRTGSSAWTGSCSRLNRRHSIRRNSSSRAGSLAACSGGRSQPQPPPSGGLWGPGAAPGYQQQPPPPPQYPARISTRAIPAPGKWFSRLGADHRGRRRRWRARG